VRGDEQVIKGGEKQALQCYHFVQRKEPICPPHAVNGTLFNRRRLGHLELFSFF
jgi:hypothetical protein